MSSKIKCYKVCLRELRRPIGRVGKTIIATDVQGNRAKLPRSMVFNERRVGRYIECYVAQFILEKTPLKYITTYDYWVDRDTLNVSLVMVFHHTPDKIEALPEARDVMKLRRIWRIE